MNLRILSIATMIVMTKFWLTNARAVAILTSHELGQALKTQLEFAYQMLLTLHKRRTDAKAEIGQLTSSLTDLDDRHDNSARGMYYHLLALRATTRNPALAAFCTHLLDVCFADGLSIINRSYREEGGFSEALVEQITPEIHARLATIQVGEFTLDEVCQSWLSAGTQLGQMVLERDRLQVAVATTGASDEAIRAHSARSYWINTVHGMKTNVDVMRLSDAERETLFAPLYRSIAAAERPADTPVQDTTPGEQPSEQPSEQPGEQPGKDVLDLLDSTDSDVDAFRTEPTL